MLKFHTNNSRPQSTNCHFCIFAKSSSSRSCESLTPFCIPLWSMPSRSATDWNTALVVTHVLPPGSSSNVAVSRLTCPGSGKPSSSNVLIILSGRVTHDALHEKHTHFHFHHDGYIATNHHSLAQTFQATSLVFVVPATGYKVLDRYMP